MEEVEYRKLLAQKEPSLSDSADDGDIEPEIELTKMKLELET